MTGASSGAPIVPASAHTAARIHRNPGRRAGRTAPSNGPQGPPSGTLLGRPHRAARRSGPSPHRAGHLSSTHPVRPRFKTLRQDHRQRPARAQKPRFTNAPSTATSRAASTRRVRCPRTPAHRAVLATSTTYRPNAPSPPRPPGGTPPGMILTITKRGPMLLISIRAVGHRGSRNRSRPGPDQHAVHPERHIPREPTEYRPICGRHATTVASARSHQEARLQVPAEWKRAQEPKRPSTHRVKRPRNPGQHRTRRWQRRTRPRCSNNPRRRPTAWPHPSKIRVKARPAVRSQVRTEPNAPGRPDAMRGAQALHGDGHAPRWRSWKRACPRRRGPPTSRWTPSTASAWTGNPSCARTGRPRRVKTATSSTTRLRTRTWLAKPRPSARRGSHARDSSSHCRRQPVRSPGGRRLGDGRSAAEHTS